MIAERSCILMFIKSPERGMVKSRLAKDTDEDMALCLYKHFVLDLLKTLKTSGYPLKLCFYPPDALRKVSMWLGKGYSYMPQMGKNLGERMKNAFLNTFAQGFAKVILIGSDTLDLTRSTITEAFAFDYCDTVIGPSFDGGYYLIGFKHDTFCEEIFDHMQWGTETVFRTTMAIFRKKKYAVHVLSEKRDIDRLDDLRVMAEQCGNTNFAESGTMQFIRHNYAKLFGETKHH